MISHIFTVISSAFAPNQDYEGKILCNDLLTGTTAGLSKCFEVGGWHKKVGVCDKNVVKELWNVRGLGDMLSKKMFDICCSETTI